MSELKSYNLQEPEIQGILRGLHIESKGMVVGSPCAMRPGVFEPYYDYENDTLKYRRREEQK